MKRTVLVSFVGRQDPLNRDGGAGPLLTLLNKISPDRVYLLYAPTEEEMLQRAEKTKEEIMRRHHLRDVHIHKVSIKDPTDHIEVYERTKSALLSISRRENNSKFLLNISSGTPQMQIAFYLLVASRLIRGSLIYQPDPRYNKNLRFISPWERGLPEVLPPLPADGAPRSMSLDEDLRAACKELGITLKSYTIKEKVALAEKYAMFDLPVIIYGESGTGKELFARLIHRLSPRADGPYEAFNCAAIPEQLAEAELFGYKKGAFTGATKDHPGLFKLADGGTLFLDEVAELSPTVQAKLLRVIQYGEFRPLGSEKTEKVDVRLITATNKNIEREVSEGRFREDLYWRIAQCEIRLPALRERPEDIVEIAETYIEERFNKPYGTRKRLTEEAKKKLLAYHWPGNVRELYKRLINALVRSSSDEIKAEDIDIPYGDMHPVKQLPVEPYEGFDLERAIERLRDYYYERAYIIAGGNQSQAAKLLGVTPQRVHQWVKQNRTKQ